MHYHGENKSSRLFHPPPRLFNLFRTPLKEQNPPHIKRQNTCKAIINNNLLCCCICMKPRPSLQSTKTLSLPLHSYMYIDIEICYSSTTDNAFSSFPYMHISMSCEYPRENVLLEQGGDVGGVFRATTSNLRTHLSVVLWHSEFKQCKSIILR